MIDKCFYKKGSSLTFVFIIFLVLFFYCSALWSVSGSFIPKLKEYEIKIQKRYTAESAILLKTYGYDSYKSYPIVQEDTLDAWLLYSTEIDSEIYKALAGFFVRPMDISFLKEKIKDFQKKKDFEKQNEWKQSSCADTLYGNTFFYRLKGSEFLQSLCVQNGDLRIYLQQESIPHLKAYVNGDVFIEGDGVIDSLDLYSTGRAEISGKLCIKGASIYSIQKVEVKNNVWIRGVVLSKDTVIYEETSLAKPLFINSYEFFENHSKDTLFFPVGFGLEKARIFEWQYAKTKGMDLK
jgi:hypothetical protein